MCIILLVSFLRVIVLVLIVQIVQIEKDIDQVNRLHEPLVHENEDPWEVGGGLDLAGLVKRVHEDLHELGHFGRPHFYARNDYLLFLEVARGVGVIRCIPLDNGQAFLFWRLLFAL